MQDWSDDSNSAGAMGGGSLMGALDADPIVPQALLARARADLLARISGQACEPTVKHSEVWGQEVAFGLSVSIDAWRHFETRMSGGDPDSIRFIYSAKGEAVLHRAGTEFRSCILELPEPTDGEQKRLGEAAEDHRAEAIARAEEMLEDDRVECLAATVLRLVARGLAPDLRFFRTDQGFGKVQGHFLVGDVLLTRSKLPLEELLAACRRLEATTLCVVQELSEGPNSEPNRTRIEMVEAMFGSEMRVLEIARPAAARLSFFSTRKAEDPSDLISETISSISADRQRKMQEIMDQAAEIYRKAVREDPK